MLAHSMGNIVASEALRREAMSLDVNKKIVHTYVASQAAFAASAFDPNVKMFPANWLHANYDIYVPDGTSWGGPIKAAIEAYNLLYHGTTSSTLALTEFLNAATPDIYTNFPVTGQAYFERIGNAAEKMYNFYNPNDGAEGDADAWPTDQALKPDTTVQLSTPWPYPLSAPWADQLLPLNYDYNGAFFTEQWQGPTGVTLPPAPLNLSNPYDAYAAMAYAADAKSKALGVTPNVGFGFTTAGQINLRTDFDTLPGENQNFGNTRADHGGQFNLDYMRRHQYWESVMKRFGLATNQTSGDRP